MGHDSFSAKNPLLLMLDLETKKVLTEVINFVVNKNDDIISFDCGKK